MLLMVVTPVEPEPVEPAEALESLVPLEEPDPVEALVVPELEPLETQAASAMDAATPNRAVERNALRTMMNIC